MNLLVRVVAIGLMLPLSVWAQAWPTKPIRMVAEFGAGSGGDQLLRVIQPGLGAAFGQPLVIENRPGAGGVVAAGEVSRATPDGYTIGGHTTNALISRRFLQKGGAPVDVFKDLTPITAVGETVTLVLAGPASPARSLKELIDYARKNPGKLSYGTSGFGSVHHLSQEQVQMITRTSLTHVPYKTGAAAVVALMASEIPVAYAILGSIGPHLKSGKLTALARSGSQRYKGLPDVPALSEVAPGFETVPSWTGLFAPPRLPAPILKRLGSDAVKVLHSAEVTGKMTQVGFEVIGNTPEEFTALIRKQVDAVGRIVKAANIQPVE